MDTAPSTFDASGWFTGKVGPSKGATHATLFTSNPAARFDLPALRGSVEDLCGATLSLEPAKLYPSGAAPLQDVAFFQLDVPGVGAGGVAVITFPVERALALRKAALECARTKGGGGMDSLVLRARRVIEIVPKAGEGEAHAWVLAYALALADLAAIHPADDSAVFGPKTARARLGALGVTLR
jgi:hypothetical protein